LPGIALPDKYAKALSALDDVQTAIDLALPGDTVGQIPAKIAGLCRCIQRISSCLCLWQTNPDPAQLYRDKCAGLEGFSMKREGLQTGFHLLLSSQVDQP